MSRSVTLVVCICATLVLSQDTFGQRGRGGIIRRIFRRQPIEEPESKEKKEESKKSDSKSKTPKDSIQKNNINSSKPKAAPDLDTAKLESNAKLKKQITNRPPTATFGLETQFDVDAKELVVRSVAKDSAAYKSGIREGDEILSVAGVAIENADTLPGLAEVLSQGDVVKLEIARKGKRDSVELTIEQNGSTVPPKDNGVAPLELSDSAPEVLPLRFANAEPNRPESGLSSILELSPPSSAPAPQPKNQRTVETLRQTLAEQRAIIDEQNSEIRRLRQLLESRGR